ncbi:MAG: hypothetical protein KJ066_11900 [Acidobacteria bacterium]|nr:hypothetical protein [Acidobacteriota bacterium]
MTPLWLTSIPQPEPLAQPGPTWLLWTLLMLTFVLHLVPMNLVLGGALLNVVSRWRARRGHAHAGELAALITKATPVGIAAAVNFGVAPLLFLQVLYGRVFFTSSILMAWWWLAVVPILIAAYYGAYVLSFRGERLGRGAVALAWFVLLLLVAISFIYSNNMSLMIRPDVFGEKYLASGQGWHLNAGDPTLVPRWLHMVLGAVAVAGLGVAALGLARRRGDPAFAAWAMRHGSLWCAAATSLNILTGFWWLALLPTDTLVGFMGRDAASTFVLAIGTLAGLGVLTTSWLAARAEDPSSLVWTGLGLMGVTLVFMALTRDQARWGVLTALGFRPVEWVEPQWGPIALFLVLLVVAFASIGWMLQRIVVERGRADGLTGAR